MYYMTIHQSILVEHVGLCMQLHVSLLDKQNMSTCTPQQTQSRLATLIHVYRTSPLALFLSCAQSLTEPLVVL